MTCYLHTPDSINLQRQLFCGWWPFTCVTHSLNCGSDWGTFQLLPRYKVPDGHSSPTWSSPHANTWPFTTWGEIESYPLSNALSHQMDGVSLLIGSCFQLRDYRCVHNHYEPWIWAHPAWSVDSSCVEYRPILHGVCTHPVWNINPAGMECGLILYGIQTQPAWNNYRHFDPKP